MNEEEIKEAKEFLKDTIINSYSEKRAIKLDNLRKYIENLEKEIEKRDRQIDLMAEYISEQDIDEDICRNLHCANAKNCNECIKQYFKNKAEEN